VLAALGVCALIAAVLGFSFEASRGLLVIILGAAAILFSAVAITMPSGAILRVTGLVTVAAAALLGFSGAVIVMFVGSLLGRLSARSMSAESFVSQLKGALYSAALAGGAALAFTGIERWASPLGGLASTVAPLTAGLLYGALDLLGAAFSSAEPKPRGVATALVDLVRTTYSLYLGQVCLGVVAVLLWPSMREWSVVLLTVLGLILLYSFNLYLRVRSSYQETIRALGRVSDLSFPTLDGHAQRVSDLAVAVGRRLGCSPRQLENLNYAALLHGLGRVGDEADGEPASGGGVQAERGARIVEKIPFLADTADLIRYQDAPADPSCSVSPAVLKLAHVVGVCAEYSVAYRAAVDLGELDPASVAIRRVMSDDSRSSDPDIVEALTAEVGATLSSR
jgi:hypothetical protein